MTNSKELKDQFKNILLAWYEPATRPMPWKGERDPYRIWISEVVLQQTRVEQGWHYYTRFIERFPTVADLASAPIEDVLKLWQGLGYYRRANNLHKGAVQVMKEHDGKIPQDLKAIKNISSIGDYTGAAIASFAFDLPHAVVDGNVIRVLARIFGIYEAFDTGSGRRYFQNLADELIDHKNPAIYNQAIMDLGATVCMPTLPKCQECPFQEVCYASQENKIGDLPVKTKKIKKRDRYFNYLLFQYKDQYLVSLRNEKDIYSGMYEFTLLESDNTLHEYEIISAIENRSKSSLNYSKIIIPKPHILTHQRLHVTFFKVELQNLIPIIKDEKWVSKEQLSKLPVPKFIHDYIMMYL